MPNTFTCLYAYFVTGIDLREEVRNVFCVMHFEAVKRIAGSTLVQITNFIHLYKYFRVSQWYQNYKIET